MRAASVDKMIKDAQRRALFAWASENGKTIDDLRDMAPAGSISMMTCEQASRLLDRLNGKQSSRPKRRKRRPKTVYAMVSEDQRAKIVALRMELGWSADRLDAWLSKRHYRNEWPKRPMNKIDSSSDAADVIELLKGVVIKSERARKNRQRSAESVSAA